MEMLTLIEISNMAGKYFQLLLKKKYISNSNLMMENI